ncbi:hypothetical protein HOY80DRAFT_112452 [Tuber brumale]|nr:hypothetical protein HOY80DRAFT_112452 [Tuber brumale]
MLPGFLNGCWLVGSVLYSTVLLQLRWSAVQEQYWGANENILDGDQPAVRKSWHIRGAFPLTFLNAKSRHSARGRLQPLHPEIVLRISEGIVVVFTGGVKETFNDAN